MTIASAPDLSRINLNLLVALDALLATGNVRRAAERAGVTQSAMSHTLRQLREVLGDPLLVRSGNAMLPTPRAERLALPLRDALHRLAAVVADEQGFEPAGSARRFVVAASDVVAVTALPALVALLGREAPSVELDVVTADRDRAGSMLEHGEVDVAIAPGPPRGAGLCTRSLYRSEFAVVMREGHPALSKRLDLDTYCRLSHALVTLTGHGPGVVDEALAKKGRARRIALRIPYFLAAPALLAQSDLVLTAPRHAVEHLAQSFGLRVVPAPLSLPRGTVSLVWHERYDAEPASRWLRDALVRATAGLRAPEPAQSSRASVRRRTSTSRTA